MQLTRSKNTSKDKKHTSSKLKKALMEKILQGLDEICKCNKKELVAVDELQSA